MEKQPRKKIVPKPKKVELDDIQSYNDKIMDSPKVVHQVTEPILPKTKKEYIKRTQSLQSIVTVVPTDKLQQDTGTISWSDAEKAATENGALIRCRNWIPDMFLFYRAMYSKPVKEGTRGLYPPVSLQYLQSKGIKRLIIGEHWVLYKPEGKLVVGYNVQMNDRLADWELYKQ